MTLAQTNRIKYMSQLVGEAFSLPESDAIVSDHTMPTQRHWSHKAAPLKQGLPMQRVCTAS